MVIKIKVIYQYPFQKAIVSKKESQLIQKIIYGASYYSVALAHFTYSNYARARRGISYLLALGIY
jgi:hypothetical protein